MLFYEQRSIIVGLNLYHKFSIRTHRFVNIIGRYNQLQQSIKLPP